MAHPADGTELEFVCLEDGAMPSENGINIFTDGSKLEGKVGAALSVWHGDAETKTRKLKLENYCTVFQAELLALNEAVKCARSSSECCHNILSDSRSALQMVINPNANHPLAIQVRNNIKEIREQSKRINLYWIRAHIGTVGNERADELAKEAALKTKRKADYDKCPVSFVKRQIRKDSLDEWNRRYMEGTTASTTKIFFPNAIEAYKIVRKIEMEATMVQVFTGHGGFSKYLHRFKCKEDPSCSCESGTEQDVLHLIVDCPIYNRQRHD
ncbi:PREDICTED: uncharacterized protein LOC106115905, partial [Papilio xuthus]|uniref:Uncharacterized protein LOC106115905 n=1 Tax=Papilio xuthus TaxID=66420 RepID=A0AAJ6Z468_PAPXU